MSWTIYSQLSVFSETKKLYSQRQYKTVLSSYGRLCFFPCINHHFHWIKKNLVKILWKKKSFNSLTLLRIYRYNARQYAYLFVNVWICTIRRIKRVTHICVTQFAIHYYISHENQINKSCWVAFCWLRKLTPCSPRYVHSTAKTWYMIGVTKTAWKMNSYRSTDIVGLVCGVSFIFLALTLNAEMTAPEWQTIKEKFDAFEMIDYLEFGINKVRGVPPFFLKRYK